MRTRGIDSVEGIRAVGPFARLGVVIGALSDERVTICDTRSGSQDPRIPTLAVGRPVEIGQLYSVQSLAL
jgi:hypothetical protein